MPKMNSTKFSLGGSAIKRSRDFSQPSESSNNEAREGAHFHEVMEKEEGEIELDFEEKERETRDGYPSYSFSQEISSDSDTVQGSETSTDEAKVKKFTKTKKKVGMEKIGYTKPDISVNQLKERRHIREATEGVVQLFNAVRQRQQFLDSKLKVLEKGTKADKRKAIDEIKSYQFQTNFTTLEKKASAKRLKSEMKEETTDDDYESEGNITDASIGEVKKEEESDDDGINESDGEIVEYSSEASD